MSIVLFILKLSAAILTVVLGIFGILSNPRDATTGKITKCGKLVIGAIVVFAIIGLVIDRIQDVQESQERTSLHNDLSQAHKDILRSSNQMNIAFAIFSLGVKKDDVSIHDGLAEIEKSIFAIDNRDDFMRRGMMPDADNSSVLILPDAQFSVIGKKAQQKLEMFSMTAYCYTDIDVSLLKNDKLPKPDLSFECLFFNMNDGNGPHLFYCNKTNSFSVEAQIRQEQISFEANSEKMTSLLDLIGATIIFHIKEKFPLVLENATLYFGKGRSYDIPYFTQVQTSSGCFYAYKFPSDADFSVQSHRNYTWFGKINYQ